MPTKPVNNNDIFTGTRFMAGMQIIIQALPGYLPPVSQFLFERRLVLLMTG